MHLLPALRTLARCLVLCAAISGPVYAQLEDAVAAFDEGNTHYKGGDYALAIEAYTRAIDSGYTSGELYYNLGNAYFRSDDLGQAIRYFEKARQFIPENPELMHNLEFAREQTIDQLSQLPVPWWIQWWRSYIILRGGRQLLWAGVLFYIAGVALFIHRMRTHSRNPWIRRSMTAAISLAGLFLFTAFAASIQSDRRERAVVINESLPLQLDPSTEASSETTIHEGLVVDVLQDNGDWVEIRLPNGTRGWVLREDIADV